MNVTIIGTGYIGLVQSVVMSDLGFDVVCIDNDAAKIETLKQGKSLIYEPGLEETLKKSLKNGKIKFTLDYNFGIKNADVIFLAVGTPPLADGSSNLNYITAASKNLAQFLSKDSLIITKSTVPMGTNKKIKKIISDELKKRKMGNLNVSVISNPEFLREGKAVYDFLNPDRIVVGIDENDNKEKIKKEIYKIYEYFLKKQIPIIFTNLETAELSKYSSNAFLSVKISFINEMAMLSEKIGANIEDVSKIMGFDHRIGNEFLNAGLGFGGSCFPKDTLAILNIGKNNDCKMSIVNSAVKFNDDLKDILIKKIKNKLGNVKGKTISILGLSFKPETDDIRESPAIKIIKKVSLLLFLKAGVRPSFEKPLDYEETNIKGTLNLLELCKKFKINNFVCASSSSVYGDTPKLPFSESDNIKKTLSPYALTKKTCEEMAYLYYKNYGIKVVMLRFFTVYGPGQRPDLAIHKFAKKLKYNEKISIYGDGKTGRAYTYIDDIIAGIIASIKFINKKNECYEIFNLGNNRVITLMEMVKIMEKISGYKADLEFCDFQKGDMPMTYADISKAKKLLGYSPKTDFKNGIEKFFEWFEKKESGEI